MIDPIKPVSFSRLDKVEFDLRGPVIIGVLRNLDLAESVYLVDDVRLLD